MPSQQDPSTIETGPGKLPIDVATAATNLFAISSSSILTSLSNIANRELAISAASDVFTTVGPQSSITLFSGDGPFYVGDSISDELLDLFHVVDGTDAEIFNPLTQQYVFVSSITPATVGSGFFSGNITLNLSTPIPPGHQYHVYYGRRTTLGEIPPNATTFPAVRRSPDRVRFPDLPREGLAPASVAVPFDIVTNGYLDPYMALWKAVLRGNQPFNVMPIPAYGGSMGFVNIGRKKNVNDAADQGLQGHQSAGFFNAYIKETIGTGTIGGANPLTRVDPSLAALAISGSVVELHFGDFFRTSTASAIRPGIDMLEVTRANSNVEVYVITAFDSVNTRRATLRSLGGALANLSVSESIKCRWIRPSFFLGGDNDQISVSSPESFHLQGFANLTSGPITDNSGVEVVQEPPFFGAARNTRTGGDSARGYWDVIAFRWGGFNMTDPSVAQIGRRDVKGELWGDGSMESYGGRIRGLLSSRADQLNVSATQGYTWNPHNFTQVTFIANTASVAVLTITLDSAYTAQAGDEITFFLNYSTTGIALSVVYPATFKFSGADGSTPLVLGTVSKFVGTFSNGNFYFTRTDYV